MGRRSMQVACSRTGSRASRPRFAITHHETGSRNQVSGEQYVGRARRVTDSGTKLKRCVRLLGLRDSPTRRWPVGCGAGMRLNRYQENSPRTREGSWRPPDHSRLLAGCNPRRRSCRLNAALTAPTDTGCTGAQQRDSNQRKNTWLRHGFRNRSDGQINCPSTRQIVQSEFD